jgi:redox-sensitive bicupin YhaK (pirin superfamily)
MQAFPSAFSSEESDPFLMCDHYGPTISKGAITDPDDFPIGWHPHRGMDICSYLVTGTGRHADSMGNRGSFATPGIQWISVGSGIEHAEGGGTPKGDTIEGFQIWINVPAEKKMEDPAYGSSAEPLPLQHPAPGVTLRVVAGAAGTGAGAGAAAGAGTILSEEIGPFHTVSPVQMVDIMLAAGVSYVHTIEPVSLDNCLVYAYKGAGTLENENIRLHHAARLDASDAGARQFTVTAGPEGLSVIVFAGKRLNEKVAWRGPIVMNTEAELKKAFQEYSSGSFLKKKTAWDYKHISAFPEGWGGETQETTAEL